VRRGGGTAAGRRARVVDLRALHRVPERSASVELAAITRTGDGAQLLLNRPDHVLATESELPIVRPGGHTSASCMRLTYYTLTHDRCPVGVKSLLYVCTKGLGLASDGREI
jgi:hypothetical protein